MGTIISLPFLAAEPSESQHHTFVLPLDLNGKQYVITDSWVCKISGVIPASGLGGWRWDFSMTEPNPPQVAKQMEDGTVFVFKSPRRCYGHASYPHQLQVDTVGVSIDDKNPFDVKFYSAYDLFHGWPQHLEGAVLVNRKTKYGNGTSIDVTDEYKKRNPK